MKAYSPIVSKPTPDTFVIGCTCGWQSAEFVSESLTISAFVRHTKVSHPITRKKYAFVASNMLKEREKNDCTVRALAHAAEVSYDEAHAYLASCGRRPGKGFVVHSAYNNSTLGGYRTKQLPADGMTFKELLDYKMLPERCILLVRRHVLAVIDGVVYDSFKIGSSRRVFTVWEFIKEK